MIKKLKIDSLFLFLGTSIALILMLWSFRMIELKVMQVLNLQRTFDFEKNVNIDTESAVISVLNPGLELHVSVDGGDHFKQVSNEFNLKNLRVNDLTNTVNSWRHRPSKGGIDQNHSGLFVLVDPVNEKRSNAFPIAQSNNLSHLPQINLTISEDDLFSETNGFYTLGETAWKGEDYTKSWWERPANYKERGIKWMKKGFFSFADEKSMKSSHVKFKISGNATRGFGQKSFKVYGDKSQNDEFIKVSFPRKNQKKYHSLVLRNSGNDNTRTLFADLLMHNLAAHSNLLVQDGIQSSVFINGNYWGIYNLRERLCIENIAIKHKVKEFKVTILENGAAELKDGDEKEYDRFHALLNQLKNGEITFETVNDELDITSFIDYIFFETYFANQDWPSNNSMFYKIKKGKWTWILNDMDYALAYPGSQNVNANVFTKLKNSSSVSADLFNCLMRFQTFVEMFKKRTVYHLKNTVNYARVQSEFDYLKSEIEDEVKTHSERWRAFTVSEWELNCQNNLDFLLNRTTVYSSQIEEL